MKYVILNRTTGSYWSIENGWTDLFSSTKFTSDSSAARINYPLEGVRITLKAAKNLRDGILEI